MLPMKTENGEKGILGVEFNEQDEKTCKLKLTARDLTYFSVPITRDLWFDFQSSTHVKHGQNV